MNLIKKFLIVIIIIITAILLITDKKEDKILIKKEMTSYLNIYKKENKTIIFRGVAHIAEKDFYSVVFKEALFYKKSGYVFFHEEMKQTKNIKNKSVINNFNEKIKNYKMNIYAKDKEKLYNQSIFEEVFRHKYNLFDNAVASDFTEDKFAETLIKNDYKNKDYDFLYNNILIKERNNVIINKIKENKEKNIYIMYGISHLKDLEHKLNKLGYKKQIKTNKLKIMEYYEYE